MFSSLIKTIVSIRFAKFCTVGASGVVVNLSILALFSDLLGININLASALAILVSINTNFFINEAWTFRDRTPDKKGLSTRWIRFHFVSAVGAIVQWSLFISLNMSWLWLLGGDMVSSGSLASDQGWFSTYILQPIKSPPDVGALKYLSQLIGIGVATLWNFLANFHWTWKKKEK